jgi:hypothetical protein
LTEPLSEAKETYDDLLGVLRMRGTSPAGRNIVLLDEDSLRGRPHELNATRLIRAREGLASAQG